jgi:hypothetical protein
VNVPLLRTAIAAVGLAAGLLTGCTGTPATGDVPPTTALAPPAGPAPLTSWTPVIDAGTGVSADLPGPARQATEPVLSYGPEDEGVAYHALEPSGRVEAVLHISPLPTGERPGPDVAAERTAHHLLGALVESRPLVVEGHPAVDARIDGWPRGGGSGNGTLILRIIDTPGFEVTVEANGDIADAALAQQVFDQVCASLRIP